MISVQIGRIIKNGTSLAVVIPVNILRALKIERGDQVAFAVAEGDIICMRKITDIDKFNIKPKNINLR
jgi:antitoxin component of MazEF toxin-antitoxin module